MRVKTKTSVCFFLFFFRLNVQFFFSVSVSASLALFIRFFCLFVPFFPDCGRIKQRTTLEKSQNVHQRMRQNEEKKRKRKNREENGGKSEKKPRTMEGGMTGNWKRVIKAGKQAEIAKAKDRLRIRDSGGDLRRTIKQKLWRRKLRRGGIRTSEGRKIRDIDLGK